MADGFGKSRSSGGQPPAGIGKRRITQGPLQMPPTNPQRRGKTGGVMKICTPVTVDNVHLLLNRLHIATNGRTYTRKHRTWLEWHENMFETVDSLCFDGTPGWMRKYCDETGIQWFVSDGYTVVTWNEFVKRVAEYEPTP
jgi:hypothetical protein